MPHEQVTVEHWLAGETRYAHREFTQIDGEARPADTISGMDSAWTRQLIQLRVARSKALLAAAREIIAAARNQRHTATLRRALDKQLRARSSGSGDSPRPTSSPPSRRDSGPRA